jgi:transcriptional regulator
MGLEAGRGDVLRLARPPALWPGFRQRIGESGCEWLLSLTVRAGLDTQTLKQSSLSVVNVDTTVQEKAIAFPTDARLYHKARIALVRQAKQENIALRQSYTRVGKLALAKHGRYANAKQMKRAKREQRKLRTYLGRIIRDIERKADPAQLQRLAGLLTIAQRIHQISSDVLQVEEGSLYPALQRILVKGWAKAEWGVSETNRRVRFYRLTPAGRQQLAAEMDDYERVNHAIRAVLRTA